MCPTKARSRSGVRPDSSDVLVEFLESEAMSNITSARRSTAGAGHRRPARPGNDPSFSCLVSLQPARLMQVNELGPLRDRRREE